MSKKKQKVKQVEKIVEETIKSLRDGAEDLSSDTKLRGARAAQDAGDTLRSAAQALRDGSLQDRTFGQLAERLADAADAVRDKDLDAMGRDAADFARRNPALFIGGAAVLGFAVAHLTLSKRSQA